ncbi:DUF481 domain-containing protein [Arenibacterium sp. CAU 1754]
MNDLLKFTAASALVAMMAAPAVAQTGLTGIDSLEDRIEDIEDEAKDDLERGDDDERYSANRVAQGWRGSLALTGSSASGNTDTAELSGAGRLTYGINDWSHTFGFAAEYGEANDVKNEENFFAIYEGSYYFTDRFYLFGVGRYEFDGFTAPAVPGGAPVPGETRDAFVGFGPGYRILNDENVAWRVQGGVGARYYEDITGFDTTEAAFLGTSRFYYKLTGTMSLTNDTEVLTSDVNTLLTNDLGVNFKMTDSLSTRVSYRTEYNTDPAPGRESTDNRFGVSLVLGF